MLRIKLILKGKKHAPTYRVGVGEGSAVKETFGVYNPQVSPAEFKIDKKRLEYWLGHGAKLTDSVDLLLRGKYEFKPYSIKKDETEGETAAPTAEATPVEAAPQEVPAEAQPEEAPAEAPKAEEEPKKEGSGEGTA